MAVVSEARDFFLVDSLAWDRTRSFKAGLREMVMSVLHSLLAFRASLPKQELARQITFLGKQ